MPRVPEPFNPFCIQPDTLILIHEHFRLLVGTAGDPIDPLPIATAFEADRHCQNGRLIGL
jgi:hypothetical protein